MRLGSSRPRVAFFIVIIIVIGPAIHIVVRQILKEGVIGVVISGISSR